MKIFSVYIVHLIKRNDIMWEIFLSVAFDKGLETKFEGKQFEHQVEKILGKTFFITFRHNNSLTESFQKRCMNIIDWYE